MNYHDPAGKSRYFAKRTRESAWNLIPTGNKRELLRCGAPATGLFLPKTNGCG